LEKEKKRLEEEVRDVREEWARLEGRVCCLEEEVESKDRRIHKIESGNGILVC